MAIENVFISAGWFGEKLKMISYKGLKSYCFHLWAERIENSFYFLMKPESKQGLAHGPSAWDGQDWLFPAGGHSWAHSQTPGVEDMCRVPIVSSRNRAGNVDLLRVHSNKANFLTFRLLKILKQYFVLGLSEVNVPAWTSPHPASHFSGWL